MPWLISPNEYGTDRTGGRHGLIYDEVYDTSSLLDLYSYKWGKQSFKEPITYDDCWGFYVLPQASQRAAYTLILDQNTTFNATDEQIELARQVTAVSLTDTELYMSKDEGDQMLHIHHGVVEPKPYGRMRAYTDTIAPMSDVVGRAREIENYAAYAAKYGLSKPDFRLLTEFAVDAFRQGRQVSLDALCQTIQQQQQA